MIQKSSLDKALKLIRNLIERLRDLKEDNRKNEKSEERGPSTFFTRNGLGGFYLTGKVDKQYRECLDNLIAVQGRKANAPIQSRGAVENLLQTAILRSVRPKKTSRVDDPITFRRRTNREMSALRNRFLAAPLEWKVTIQVFGISAKTLPLTFGSIEFVSGSEDAGKVLANSIPDFEPTSKRASRKTIQEEKSHRENIRRTIKEKFSAEAIATARIHAFDAEAAQKLGIEKIRRSVDILNFFAPYFHEHHDVYRAFLASDGKRTHLPSLVNNLSETSARWNNEKSYDTPIEKISIVSERGKEVGLARAAEIFGLDEHTDLDLRILNALGWAGRATVEHRSEEAFLLWAIALEALLTNPKARTGVTDRLRFRAAWLIGKNVDARKRIRDLLTNLYALRSNIVHAGDSTDLTDGDLRDIRRIVRASLTHVLTDPKFPKMSKAAEFEQFLDDNLWS